MYIYVFGTKSPRTNLNMPMMIQVFNPARKAPHKDIRTITRAWMSFIAAAHGPHALALRRLITLDVDEVCVLALSKKKN